MDWSKYPAFVQAIRYWWKAAGQDVLPPFGRPLQDYLNGYKDEGQIAALDKTLRSVNQDKYKAAMEKLAGTYKTKAPPIGEIVSAVSLEAAKLNFNDYSNVGREVLTDTANAFKFGVPFLLAVGVIALVLVYAPKGKSWRSATVS